jgi:hypothetical protein
MPTQAGIYQHRHLQQNLRQVLRRRLRTLPFYGGDLIPTSTDLQPGVRELIQDQVLEFGEAQLMAPEADDIPLVEINATENTYRVVMPVAGYSVTFAEEMAQNVARGNGIQYSPRDIKMQAVVRLIEEKCNKVAAVGNSTLNFTGLLNNPGVTPINSSFDPFSAGSTPDDIADWFLSLIADIFINSNNIEYPNTALISTNLHELMARRRMPDSSETILSYVVKTQQARSTRTPGRRIEAIEPLIECSAEYLEANGVESGGTNKDRVVLYPNDPEVVEKHIMSGAMAMFPEDWVVNKGARRIYPMYSFMSQTIINFPGAFSYIKHDKEV